jgi:hypothetical protein
MARQGFASIDAMDFPPGSFTAIANTLTRTNLWTQTIWTPIPAADMRAGKVYRLTAGGIISNTATPTTLWTPTFGTSATPSSNLSLGATTTVASPTGLTNAPWYLELIFGFRAIGVAASTATIVGHGNVNIGGGAAAASQTLVMGGTVVTTADNTTAQAVVVDFTWGTASVSNTVTCQGVFLQSLN